ncbi:spermidine/putrescine ABC transporter substrate-binding protein [Marinobacterium zhoushanense]|uniref:Spermidine/putrescine ABC transporter substrate-binding protein n=1 Tax=Marinobacterium zhoushanense TaxID=1679163 RepID=A0ABQ1KXP9_9GAMM|nr:spermidine/putrescine ABC transporter substrate-binding protein [Marinobacterium zhoushanense]GGC11909.1 spermidine/putrescine ABC transporter substrate-binding protein [Marinobacterium zhoushanense]
MLYRLGMAALLTLLLSPYTMAEKLTLLNWEAYLDPEVIEIWEAETGVEIEQIYFDNDERRDRMMVDAGRHHIDLVVLDEVASRLFGERGISFAPTAAQAPNLRHLDPQFSAQCGNHSIPYMWGTLGIAYRSDKVAQPPASWSDLIKPAQELVGHIGMLDDGADLLAPALLMRGESINSDSREALQIAFEDLKQQVPAVLTYDYAITFLQSNADASQLYMALVYSGDQDALNEIQGGEHWRYVAPSEGTILWADCLGVLQGSNKQELAIRFIDFLNRPEIAARNAQALWVGTPNQAAYGLLDDEFRQDITVYPPAGVMAKSQLYEVLSEENLMLRQRITSAIRKLHDAQ